LGNAAWARALARLGLLPFPVWPSESAAPHADAEPGTRPAGWFRTHAGQASATIVARGADGA